MLFSLPVCSALWLTVWCPLLRACPGLRFNDLPMLDLPRWPLVRRLGPVFLQRWVAQAVANRLAWQQHSWITPHFYQYGHESDLSWERAARLAYPRAILREMSEASLRWRFGVQVEYLLRLVEPGSALSAEQRLLALGGTSLHVAQVYAEWKRRCGWRQAREIVRDALAPFLDLPAQTA